MFRQGKTIGIIVAVIIVAFAVLKFNQLTAPTQLDIKSEDAGLDEQTLNNKHSLVTDYLKAHISEISPEPAVLGGTFYVTNVAWLDDDRAIVDYEDGHISLTGRLSYTLTPDQPLAITDFELIKKNNELIDKATAEISDDDLAVVAVKNSLAQKHKIDFADIKLTVEQRDDQNLRGLAQFAIGENNYNNTVLATMVNGEFTVVYDDSRPFDCDEVADYNFPETIIPECPKQN
ncbi:MAG: hypothetical protein V1765_02875 [bacterium]